jgi:hypothetical protein
VTRNLARLATSPTGGPAAACLNVTVIDPQGGDRLAAATPIFTAAAG